MHTWSASGRGHSPTLRSPPHVRRCSKLPAPSFGMRPSPRRRHGVAGFRHPALRRCPGELASLFITIIHHGGDDKLLPGWPAGGPGGMPGRRHRTRAKAGFCRLALRSARCPATVTQALNRAEAPESRSIIAPVGSAAPIATAAVAVIPAAAARALPRRCAAGLAAGVPRPARRRCRRGRPRGLRHLCAAPGEYVAHVDLSRPCLVRLRFCDNLCSLKLVQ
jgi:hypothetical protein